MMAEQKGRGGKKPKYQIADIGGSDLTSQDISTERVLNFLIKGEIGPNEPASGGESVKPEPASPSGVQPPSQGSVEPDRTSLPSPETLKKRSLAHLFQRASGGSGTPKDLKSDPGAADERPSVTPPEIGEKSEQITPILAGGETASEVVPTPRPPEMKAENEPPAPSTQIATPAPKAKSSRQIAEPGKVADVTPIVAAAPGDSELTQLAALWRGVYRLKEGEIEALNVLYQMSYGQGTTECHIKMRKLAEMSNLTYRYCQKVVRNLETGGWITKVQDYDPTTQLGVLYRINLKPSL